MNAGYVGLVVALFSTVSAMAQPVAPVGAASCSGCHRPEPGGPVPPLAGRAPDVIVAAMREFRSGAREATVMGAIAKGFSEDETDALAAWFGALPSR